jgi:hypothetical protein
MKNSKLKLRWNNKLNPKLSKLKWTDQEAKRLFELHKLHGSTWKTISKEFEGRTDNFLKNQFFSLIRRSLRRIIRFLEIPPGSLVFSLTGRNNIN